MAKTRKRENGKTSEETVREEQRFRGATDHTEGHRLVTAFRARPRSTTAKCYGALSVAREGATSWGFHPAMVDETDAALNC
jgi:hypothetical protein